MVLMDSRALHMGTGTHIYIHVHIYSIFSNTLALPIWEQVHILTYMYTNTTFTTCYMRWNRFQLSYIINNPRYMYMYILFLVTLSYIINNPRYKCTVHVNS